VLFVLIHHRRYIHYYYYKGQDNGSRTTVAALKSSINTSPVKLIVIGVGNDVHTDVLKGIASSASKGTYCTASHYCIGVAMNYHQCNHAMTCMVMTVISLYRRDLPRRNGGQGEHHGSIRQSSSVDSGTDPD
jgi:hypothetical protein